MQTAEVRDIARTASKADSFAASSAASLVCIVGKLEISHSGRFVRPSCPARVGVRAIQYKIKLTRPIELCDISCKAVASCLAKGW